MRLHLPGNERFRLVEALRLKPFTPVLGTAFVMMIVGCSVWVFAFSDDSTEQLTSGMISLVALGLSGSVVRTVVIGEKRKPFSLRARKTLWRSIIAGYVLGIVAAVWFLFAFRLGSLGALRLALYLGSFAPVPLCSWKLLRTERED